MPIDQQFALAIAVMALVTYGCRWGGYWLGVHINNNSGARRMLDLLPACALAAVIGPRLVDVSLAEAIALITAAALFLRTSRFLPALVAGAVIVLMAPWILERLAV